MLAPERRTVEPEVGTPADTDRARLPGRPDRGAAHRASAQPAAADAVSPRDPGVLRWVPLALPLLALMLAATMALIWAAVL